MHFYFNQFNTSAFQLAMSLLIMLWLLSRGLTSKAADRSVFWFMAFFGIAVFSIVLQLGVVGVASIAPFRTITQTAFVATFCAAIPIGFTFPALEERQRYLYRWLCKAATVLWAVLTILIYVNPGNLRRPFYIYVGIFIMPAIGAATLWRQWLARSQSATQTSIMTIWQRETRKEMFTAIGLSVIPILFIILIGSQSKTGYRSQTFLTSAISITYFMLTMVFIRYARNRILFLPRLILVCSLSLVLIFNFLTILMGRQIEAAYFAQPAHLIMVADNVDATWSSSEALPLRQYIHIHLLPLLWVSVATNLSILLGTLILFTDTLLKPIHSLIEGVRRVNAGDLTVRIPQQSQDELGTLTNAFNNTIASVRQSRDELEAANMILEERVTKRATELEMARDSAEKANQAKTRFLANISHELKTPLNAILGFSQLLEINHPQDPHPRIIRESGQQLLKLISDVLDLTRGEIGRFTLNPTEFDLQVLLLQIVNTVALQAQVEGLNFRYIAREFPVHVIADRHRIRQVILNLLRNAVKMTESGTVSLEIETIKKGMKSATIRVHVKDNGGVDAEQLAAIFKPYQQDDFGRNPINATRLDLLISQQLVTLMGGDLQVTSDPDLGSHFWVTLDIPLAKSDYYTPESFTHAASQRPAEQPALPPKTMLERIKSAAQIGDVSEIEELIFILMQADSDYHPIGNQILRYVNQFEMQNLRDWLNEISLVEADS